MYKFVNNIDLSLEKRLSIVFSELFNTNEFEILSKKLVINLCNEESDYYEENVEVQICLPIYREINLSYINYSVVFITEDSIFIENDYLEVEQYLGEVRIEALSSAVEELNDEHLEFLSNEWNLEIDELFINVNDGSIEQEYYSLFELYEEIFDCLDKREILEEIIKIFNRKLLDFYKGNYYFK